MPAKVRSRKHPATRRAPRTTARAPAPAPVHRPSAEAPRPLLLERPHAHIVCRACGRIAALSLDTDEELRLEAISHAAPDGWSVDLVAFSLTGACPKCRQGPAAPE